MSKAENKNGYLQAIEKNRVMLHQIIKTKAIAIGKPLRDMR